MAALEEFLGRCIYTRGAHPSQPLWEAWTLDYEIIHQLVLKALIEDSTDFLSEFIPPEAREGRCWLGGLYDLSVGTGARSVAFEIKTWTGFGLDQIARQVTTAREIGNRLYYLMLARAGSSWPRERIMAETGGTGTKLSYRELIRSLDSVSGERSELASAYRSALLQQRTRIVESGFPDPDA